MTLQNQVSPLDIAKKLKELGVVQESLFFHFDFDNMKSIEYKVDRANFCNVSWARSVYSAYTVAELGVMLGNEFTVERANNDFVRVTSIRVDNDFCAAYLADSLGQIIIEYIGDSKLLVNRINYRIRQTNEKLKA